jgi:hypothetical protein
MKKIFIPIISLIFIIIIIGIIAWFNMPNIIAHILSKEFNVPVLVGNVDISKNSLDIKGLNIGTPRGSKTKSSFYCKELDIKSSFEKIRQEVLTIDSFTLNNSIIGVEFYNSNGTDNNWIRMMKTSSLSKTKSKRKYLIKKLILNNTTVVLTKQNGQRQTFPTVPQLIVYNITEETGFPVEELEKAIANEILKSVFQRFNLLKLLEQAPSQIIKGVLPFKF